MLLDALPFFMVGLLMGAEWPKHVVFAVALAVAIVVLLGRLWIARKHTRERRDLLGE